jgi:hypothetical protein
VTPPNRIPVLFAGHSVMVHPDLNEGAYAVDGLLRRSHLSIRGSLNSAALRAILEGGAGCKLLDLRDDRAGQLP